MRDDGPAAMIVANRDVEIDFGGSGEEHDLVIVQSNVSGTLATAMALTLDRNVAAGN